MRQSRFAGAVEVLCALSVALLVFALGVIFYVPMRLLRDRRPVCEVCKDAGMHGREVCPHQMQLWS